MKESTMLDAICGICGRSWADDQTGHSGEGVTLREPGLDAATRVALGEVLAHCIVEVAPDKYECRLCDADVSAAPFVHEAECEVAYLDNRYRITLAAAVASEDRP